MTSPALPVACCGLEHVEQVDPERVAELGAAGAEQRATRRSVAGQHRDGGDLHAGDGVRSQRAERELWRGDLGGKGVGRGGHEISW